MDHSGDRAWTCDAHGVVTTGDCPTCDDELIALHDDDVTGKRAA